MRFWTLVAVGFLVTVTLCIPLIRSVNAETSDSEDASEGEFTPTMEANLPEGFPSYTPVGVIEVKDYPAYRKATSSGPASFWSLFQHIKQNDIAMTAPVELTYATEPSESQRERAMAFLYGKASLGSLGRAGAVEVADVPAMRVVSIGVRGGRTADAVSKASSRLEGWLEANANRYVADGALRVMAYNSPFIPRDRQFFEVQIPVKETSASMQVAGE
jgi:hypothetical protein